MTEVRIVVGFVHNANVLAGLPSFRFRHTQVVLPSDIARQESRLEFREGLSFTEPRFLPMNTELF